MTTPDSPQQSLIDYIESLELDDHSAARPSAAPTLAVSGQGATAYISNSSLIVADATTTTQQLQDVAYSTLLAQLHADKAVERQRQPSDWYHIYKDVLGQAGWSVPSLKPAPYTLTSDPVLLDTVSLDVLSQAAPATQVALMRQALHALRHSPDVAIWHNAASDPKVRNFQLLTCKTESGVLKTTFATFHFSANSIGDGFLWHNYEKGTVGLDASAQSGLLNEQSYSQIRHLVIDRLYRHMHRVAPLTL